LPVTREASAQVVCRLVLVVMIAVLILITSALVTSFADAWAQAGPFGGSGGQPASGVAGWLLAKQATFYRALAGLIRAAKTNGSAYWGLLGISFVYGIFHAAGPGHGKAVISSYLLANEETWRRGVVLSFASALLQAATAVTIVAIAALLIGATAKMMGDTVRVIEIISYALITLVGVRLLWVKGRGFLRAVNEVRPESEVATAAAVGAAAPLAADHLQAVGEVGSLCRHDHLEGDKHSHDGDAHEHGHDYAHAHDRAHGHDHAHGHPHEHAGEGDALPWGHAHGPEPQELAGPGGWLRGLSAIVAVGLRPCSGAILVLVFALAQGLFWAGIASTFVMGLGTAITVAAIATLAVAAKAVAKRFAAARVGYGTLVLRGVEVGAALVVTAFGVLLLTGFMASERMGMF
jgi:nickel/cobalt transporter (NicO) family protein